MQRAPLIVNRRLKRRTSVERHNPSRAGLAFSLLISLAVVSLAILVAYTYAQVTRDLPSPLSLPLLVEPPNGILLQPTRLYDNTGQHLILTLENPAATNHRYLHVDASLGSKTTAGDAQKASKSSSDLFSTPFVQASLALADPSFWVNPGYDLSKWDNPNPSTIAERLVSTLLLANEKPGLVYNLRLRLLAAQITARYGRVKILEWYLNIYPYGPLVTGADAAAHVYFHKSASDLNLAEAATLAAIAEAPQLDPHDARLITQENRQLVIKAMQSEGLISPEQAGSAARTPLNFAQTQNSEPELAPAFTRLALQNLAGQYGEERLEQGGLRIRTSLDFDLQVQLNCTVKAQLQKVNPATPGSQPTVDPGCAAARLLPTLPATGQALTTTLTAEVVIYDPQSGRILAQTGGSDLSASHPIGSLVTPLIYLTGFTRGLEPASLLWDIPSNLPASAGDTSPISPTLTSYHGPVRLRTALANDYLTPAAQLLSQIGPENVALTAQQLGINSLDAASMEHFLHTKPPFEGGEVSILELARAYGILANQGVWIGQAKPGVTGASAPATIQPVSVLDVETADGALLASCLVPQTNCETQSIPVLTPQLAYLMTNVLSDETARWPAYGHPNPLEIGRPAAAKIGQTADGTSAWTVGFTPQLLVGVWVGPVESDAPSPAAGKVAQGASAAIWHALIQYASRNLPPSDWSAPTGIQTIQVCDPSGMLPTLYCPTIVNEVFLTGNEPTQTDNLYQVFHVNRETGRLATVFTPPELVEDRVYLVVPPEAASWAHSTNLPLPPDSYDVIYTPPTTPDAVITAPQMFATVTGKINIQGTADGKDFSFYRLQVGKGLNPTEWIQIGNTNKNQVQNGILGEWDTGGLDGLYALQLLVVNKDQSLETHTVQLTLDSQPPLVNILHPADGQTFAAKDNSLVLQAAASDNLALSRVEFYLDNQLVGTLYQPPFTLSWQIKAGSHKFSAKAYDLAGNAAQTNISFMVNNK